MPDKNTKDLSYFVKALQQRQAIDDVNSKLLRLPEDEMNFEFSASLTIRVFFSNGFIFHGKI